MRLGWEDERTIALRLRCVRWGNYQVGDIRLRARDRLGLLAWEQQLDRRTLLRVYPLPETLRRIVPPVATQPFAGNEVARQKGEGLEFADLREFAPGDRVRSINWRASARRDGLVRQRAPAGAERRRDPLPRHVRGRARRRPLDPGARRARDVDARFAVPGAPRPRRARLVRRHPPLADAGDGDHPALPDRRRPARVGDRLQLRVEGRLDHPGADAAAAGARARDHAAARRARGRGARRPEGARLRLGDRRGLARAASRCLARASRTPSRTASGCCGARRSALRYERLGVAVASWSDDAAARCACWRG